MHMNVSAFSDSVQKYVRASGYSQKELASVLGLHPKVLSRKLNGNGNAYLTNLEVQCIIKTLARWQAITTQNEALQLLELAQIGPTIFSTDDWQTPPLNSLALNGPQSTTSSDSSLRTYTLQHNLPSPTTQLIGREWAVERLRKLLGRDDVRLVTLVGAGGCGKTRLAVQVASELVGGYAQGVWFVALAGVSDPGLVPMSIIQALNMKPPPSLPPIQSLITYLRNKQLLLVLDNFEHIEGAAAVVDEILTAASGLKVLVTSRVVLHLYGEYEFSVPPLDVPDPSIVLKSAELSHYGAIQLFVERAQAVVADFALTDEIGAFIAQICARLDGLPLALELAAARVKVLPPALLLERLSRARLALLTGGARNMPSRQQTLRNTITWSYDLLSSVQQIWFPRLGVFTGGWSLEAAEAMMPALAADLGDAPVSESLQDILEQLVDNSLLVRLPVSNRQVRFTMLETLREYALEQLSKRGEFERLRDWHACYYLGLAEAAEIGLRGPQQLSWLARLVADRDNFRAALEWLLQQARAGMVITSSFFAQEAIEESKKIAEIQGSSTEAVPNAGLLAIELCLRLAAALRPYWEWQGYLTEGRSWLGAVLELPVDEGARRTVLAARAKALSEAARLVCLQNDQVRAVELAEESIALWRQLNDPSGLGFALLHRGWAAHAMKDYEVAKRAYLEGVQHLSPTGNTWLRAQLLFHLGGVSGFTADFEQTRTCYAQSRELFEQVGDISAIADVLKDQGGMLILEGKYTEAIDCLLKSIKSCYELDHKQFMATGMGLLSFAVGLRQLPEPALASIHSAQLQGAADAMMDAIGLTPWTRTHPLAQMARQQIRSQVDEQSWEAAWVAGRALTVEQAIGLACRLEEELLSN